MRKDPRMEGLKRGTDGEPGGRTWSGLEVKSGTESLKGVLAMMDESVGNGSLEGEFQGKEVWKELWAWGVGNVWK